MERTETTKAMDSIFGGNVAKSTESIETLTGLIGNAIRKASTVTDKADLTARMDRVRTLAKTLDEWDPEGDTDSHAVNKVLLDEVRKDAEGGWSIDGTVSDALEAVEKALKTDNAPKANDGASGGQDGQDGDDKATTAKADDADPWRVFKTAKVTKADVNDDDGDEWGSDPDGLAADLYANQGS